MKKNTFTLVILFIVSTFSFSAKAGNIPDLSNRIIDTVRLGEYFYEYNTNQGTVFCHGEVWATVYLYGPPTIFSTEICVG